MTPTWLSLLASAGKNAGPTPRPSVTWCHPMSLQKKILNSQQWEADCVTYELDGNILNHLDNNDLWKMTIERKAYFMSFYVRASDLRNGKLAARRFL